MGAARVFWFGIGKAYAPRLKNYLVCRLVLLWLGRISNFTIQYWQRRWWMLNGLYSARVRFLINKKKRKNNGQCECQRWKLSRILYMYIGIPERCRRTIMPREIVWTISNIVYCRVIFCFHLYHDHFIAI